MQVTMLAPTFRKIVPCNLRRMIACVTRNRIRTNITQYNNESDLLSTMVPVTACRMYCTESNSQPRITLPMLVDGTSQIAPSFFIPFKLFYLSVFKIVPHIDKDFNVPEFIKGAAYATSLISKALMNKDYESLNGLVTENMIESLKTKIETLSPNQRQLIAMNESDMIIYTISDINVTTDTTNDEHSIKISTLCHYTPTSDEKRRKMMDMNISQLSKEMIYIICHYTFMRKYVNNVGGPWIATFVNHYSLI